MAVVVLDEVGLAEDSPNLPLKVLHPLLEDGTEGATKDFLDQPEVHYLCTCMYQGICFADQGKGRGAILCLA